MLREPPVWLPMMVLPGSPSRIFTRSAGISSALATIIALIPLAVGLSEGALIASELGTVVIGGLFSSTILTLLVVPVAYSLLTPVHRLLTGQKLKTKVKRGAEAEAAG